MTTRLIDARGFRARPVHVALFGAVLLTACRLDRTPLWDGDGAPDARVDLGVDAGAVAFLGTPRDAHDAGAPSDPPDTANSSHAHDAGRAAIDAGGVRPIVDVAPAPLTDRDSAAPVVDRDSAAPVIDRDSAAPSSSIACSKPCPGDRPHCLTDGTCAQCGSDADCGKDKPRCDSSTFTCVRCLQDADCSGDKPRCDSAQCVECVTHADCQDVKRPECSAQRCTTCTSDAACSARAATPVCDVAVQGDAQDASSAKGKDTGKQEPRGTGACIAVSP